MSPANASAQGFSPDRAASEGPGFKVGRLVLHPGLSVEGGYDSNVFLESTGEEDSFILRLEGYLDIATEGSQRRGQGETNAAEPQKIQFRGGLGAQYYHYFIDRVPDNVGADVPMRIMDRCENSRGFGDLLRTFCKDREADRDG